MSLNFDVRLPTGEATTARRWRPVPLVAGIGFSVAWIVGLTIYSSSTAVGASGASVVAGYAGHQAIAATQFGFTEILAAVALAVVALFLPRLPRALGLGAAAIAVVQGVLGLVLTTWAVSGAHTGAAAALNESITRLDGVKMFVLAAFALAGVWSMALPAWLRWVGVALAVTIVASGIGYLFLLNAFSVAAWVSLPLLLVWVTSLGALAARGHLPKKASS